MLAAQTELKKAEKVKEQLKAHNLINTKYLAVKEFGYIYFPLLKKTGIPGTKMVNTKFSFPEKPKPMVIQEQLKGRLTKKEFSLFPKSQEIVGKIMILEIPDQLKKKEKFIAQAYLRQNRSIETVVKKVALHEGEFRLRKVKILAGKKTKETIHRESGVKIKLDLEKTYFSARLGNERLRVAKQVKKDEEILVMFSGAAPYPLVLARHSPAKKIYGIEINPLAHQYALENVALNSFQNRIIIYEGDVRRIAPELKQKFERIVMPLPKTGELFLDVALGKVKPKGIIHLYDFAREEEINQRGEEVRELCRRYKHPVKVLRTVKCGQYSPGVFRVCFDLKVLRGKAARN